jgi:hypothetical protein
VVRVTGDDDASKTAMPQHARGSGWSQFNALPP